MCSQSGPFVVRLAEYEVRNRLLQEEIEKLQRELHQYRKFRRASQIWPFFGSEFNFFGLIIYLFIYQYRKFRRASQIWHDVLAIGFISFGFDYIYILITHPPVPLIQAGLQIWPFFGSEFNFVCLITYSFIYQYRKFRRASHICPFLGNRIYIFFGLIIYRYSLHSSTSAANSGGPHRFGI